MIKDKFTAFFIHLASSIVITSIFTAVLIFFWYPEPYFTSSGGWQGLKLVALIDIILGPSLTFIIFNKSKPIKELRTDIGIIACIQIIALSWGCYTVYLQRPIAISFWDGSFYTVSYQSVAPQYLQSNRFNTLLKNPLQFYYIENPQAFNEKLAINNEIKQKKLAPFQLVNRFKNYRPYFNHIKKHSININEVINKNKLMRLALTKILKQSTTNLSGNYYIPLISRYQNIILIFDKNGALLGTVKAPYKTNNDTNFSK